MKSTHDSCAELPQIYQSRRPEKTVLYKTLQENLETWVEQTYQSGGSVPAHIEKDFRHYLECGVLSYGFARGRCEYGHEFLVAFSCKGRGICPSCNTRHMVETAAHLVDSWYMRYSFIMPIQKYGMNVIGQVRIDMVLCKKPRQKKGRGRPRKYGTKYTKTEIKRLPLLTENLTLYGREQKVNYRTAIAKARFLNGQFVRFVWCEFEDTKGKRRPRLLLSTDTALTGLEIIKAYEKRWCIEPMFNQLKNAWGMKQAWQQTRQVLHR